MVKMCLPEPTWQCQALSLVGLELALGCDDVGVAASRWGVVDAGPKSSMCDVSPYGTTSPCLLRDTSAN